MDKIVLISIEESAKLCGWKLPAFEKMLALPIDTPKRPKYLHIIENDYLDLKEVQTYIKRSRERQLQAPIVSDELLKQKLEEIIRLPQGGKKAAIIVLSSFAGLRVGEIASLKITDVMEENGALKEKTFLYRDLTKTRQSRHIFLIDPVCREYLEPYLKARVLEKITSESKLFNAPRGGAFNGNNLAQYMKRVFIMVGLPNLSSHSGRAATAKRYLSRGKTLKFVAQILGHVNTATTARYDRVHNDEILTEMSKG